MTHVRAFFALFCILVLFGTTFTYAQDANPGSRPKYVYDYAGIISPEYESKIDSYLRNLDDTKSAEIVIYTIKSFYGHGVKKDNQEINERDFLANYIFNELSLDGITGIGKKGKDNGILILLSLERDSGGGSMRIEIGRGLEGTITDGTAGEILDSYLVPAREEYEKTGNMSFDEAFSNTIVALADRIENNNVLDEDEQVQFEELDAQQVAILVFLIMIIVMVIFANKFKGKRGGSMFFLGGGGFGGRGGGFGGGGGGSGGGGAGR